MTLLRSDVGSWGEAAVREAVIAPLVASLGYAIGTENNIDYEMSLRYPYAYLGRKNHRSKVSLSGYADYVLTAGGRVKWVIEAKAGHVEISIDDIEQAFSYANHPEVRAVYFALCNGRTFSVFQTNAGPDVGPIFECNCDILGSAKDGLFNLLSPASVLRDHPKIVPDIGIPLAPGLGSIARITGGFMSYERSTLNIPYLAQMQVQVIGGNIQRYDGDMVVFIETRAPNRIIQKLLDGLSLNDFEMRSSDNMVAAAGMEQTLFHMQTRTIIFPAGVEMVNPMNHEIIVNPIEMKCQITAIASGSYENARLSGRFAMKQEMPDHQFQAIAEGSFQLDLK